MLAVFMFSCDSNLDKNISKYIIVSHDILPVRDSLRGAFYPKFTE